MEGEVISAAAEEHAAAVAARVEPAQDFYTDSEDEDTEPRGTVTRV